MNTLRTGLLLWAALVPLQFLWHLWLAPPANGRAGLALALTVPALLLPFLAWRSGARRMLLWAGVLALFYFTHAVVAAWVSPASRVPALVQVLLCTVVIITLWLDLREQKQARIQGGFNARR